MKLAILTLTRGTVSGGYAKYLRELVPRLRAHSGIGEVRVYVPPQMADRDPSYRTWPAHLRTGVIRWLRDDVAAWKPDVAFIPSSVPLDLGSIPVVMMVRNMEPLERPLGGNPPAEAARNVVRAWVARRACKRADRVIAVSNHVRDFLVTRWKIAPEKIGTVYHGVDTGAQARPAPVPAGPFLFTAGSLRPARGLEDLVTAFCESDALREQTLAIAGSVDPGMDGYVSRLRRRLERAGVADRVHWLGRLGAEEMAWCFSHARLFVMTSRAEACPNTVLEAMAHGCLSVSTDQPPMPEFFRETALYYQRGNAASLAEKIRTALSLPDAEQEAMRNAARARAAEFTWQRSAERTLEELRKAVETR